MLLQSSGWKQRENHKLPRERRRDDGQQKHGIDLGSINVDVILMIHEVLMSQHLVKSTKSVLERQNSQSLR